MKTYLPILLLSILILFSCTRSGKDNRDISYPSIPVTYFESEMDVIIDNYHGEEISDPFRWLEVDTAKKVMEWVEKQNEITFGYLEQIPFRNEVRTRAEELYNYPKYTSPFKVGNRFIFYKNDGLQNQSVIFIQEGLDGEPKVLLDPNTMSAEGTTSVSIIGTSKDNTKAALSIHEAGSDWATIRVIDLDRRELLKDELKWVKFSGASWSGEGFYYSRYPAADKGGEFSMSNSYHSVYYHKIGDDQNKDKLVYRDDTAPQMFHNVSVTEDGKYLVLVKASGTDGYETWFRDITKEDSEFQPLFTGFTNKNSIIQHYEGRFLVRTDVNAENYRLVSVDIDDVDPEKWVEVIPESESLLQSVSTGGGKLFANYLEKATSHVYVMNYDGSEITEIDFPAPGSAGGFGGKYEDEFLFYSFSSYVTPPSIYKYDIATGKSELFYQTELSFDPSDFEEKQVTYKSKDGTEVTMFIIHKKNLIMDGNNPAYLYGYGGFNISLTPKFSTSYVLFAEQGGVIAIPNLRGGGEYGEAWHKAGMLDKKQNVFDDFIAAAIYLTDNKYTSSDKLAIAGGSNGGLLVGACMTQRPDLFAVALPAVGVMDMLRFHKFTIGWGWVPEYGSSDDPQQYNFLKAYSPYHNIKDSIRYPATMVTTADHDDRVVPAHSFKFAAKLQQAHIGENPVLIRIAKDAGHGAGKPTGKILDEMADIWSFILYNTNTYYTKK